MILRSCIELGDFILPVHHFCIFIFVILFHHSHIFPHDHHSQIKTGHLFLVKDKYPDSNFIQTTINTKFQTIINFRFQSVRLVFRNFYYVIFKNPIFFTITIWWSLPLLHDHQKWSINIGNQFEMELNHDGPFLFSVFCDNLVFNQILFLTVQFEIFIITKHQYFKLIDGFTKNIIYQLTKTTIFLYKTPSKNNVLL